MLVLLKFFWSRLFDDFPSSARKPSRVSRLEMPRARERERERHVGNTRIPTCSQRKAKKKKGGLVRFRHGTTACLCPRYLVLTELSLFGVSMYIVHRHHRRPPAYFYNNSDNTQARQKQDKRLATRYLPTYLVRHFCTTGQQARTQDDSSDAAGQRGYLPCPSVSARAYHTEQAAASETNSIVSQLGRGKRHTYY